MDRIFLSLYIYIYITLFMFNTSTFLLEKTKKKASKRAKQILDHSGAKLVDVLRHICSSPAFFDFSARRFVGPLYVLPLQAHGASCSIELFYISPEPTLFDYTVLLLKKSFRASFKPYF
jgi:hypothetical protein